METQETQYKYYAFISYSHRGDTGFAAKFRNRFPQSTLFTKDDMRWGIWLQKSLEQYRLPAVISRKLKIDPKKRIKPVFRDEDELGCGILHEELYKNLDRSKYLLVLCSPNSAKLNRDGVNYIDTEARYFISKYGPERVIPIIIDGVPNDPEKECFPPVIKEYCFNALDATKTGKEQVLSNIVAKMLNLDPDELWERERRRLLRRRIWKSAVFTLLFALLAFAGFWTWDWNHDHVECYADYVDRYGLPEGIFPLAEEDIPERHAHYRFIYRGRKRLFGERVLREVMCSNSAGYYLEEDRIAKKFSDRPARQQIEYKDDFVLDCIKIVDRNGKVLEQRNYSGNNMTCIDFKFLGEEGIVYGKVQNATSFATASGEENQAKSEISRWMLKRDKNGLLTQIRFYKNDFNIPAKNAEGIWGRSFELDQYGRIIREHYLGPDDEKLQLKNGISSIRYDYQSNTAGLLGVVWLDSTEKPVKEYKFVLDGNQNFCERSFYLAGKPAYEDGCFKVKRTYKHGNMVEAACFGIDGKPCLHKDGYAKFTDKYDERGNVIEEAYFGIDGKPCLHKYGFAKVTQKYDERGNRIEAACFGIDGKPCWSKDGVAKFTDKYDERGNMIEEVYFGIDGKPCLHKGGGAKVTNKYDARGNLEEQAYFGIDGKPCLNKYGFAKFTDKYDERGNMIEAASFGIDGKPCLDKNGVAKVTAKYDERGNVIEAAYFGIDDKPCLNKYGFAKLTNKYDDYGILIEVMYWNVHNVLLAHQKLLILAASIFPGTPAEQNAIKAGDFILVYGGTDWTNGNINMTATIQRVRDTEKQLIFARRNPDGSYEVFAKTFPAGMMGIQLTETGVDIRDCEKIMEAYRKFQAQKGK